MYGRTLGALNLGDCNHAQQLHRPALAMKYGPLLNKIDQATGLDLPTDAWTQFAAGAAAQAPAAFDIQAVEYFHDVASWSWNAGIQTLAQTGFATADSSPLMGGPGDDVPVLGVTADYTALLTGSHWSGIEVAGKSTIVTYSFPTTAPGYVAGITDPGLTPAALASWQAFSAGEAADARAALAAWGNACGLIFIEVAAGQGDINFQKLDFSGTAYDGAGGIAYRPFGDWSGASYPYFTGDLDGSGDVFMNSDIVVSYGTLLHEIGHAIGLKHPTEAWTQFAANPPVEHAVWSADDPLLTVMSPDSTLTAPAAFDIQAVQYI